jgi:hypothetical protein
MPSAVPMWLGRTMVDISAEKIGLSGDCAGARQSGGAEISAADSVEQARPGRGG